LYPKGTADISLGFLAFCSVLGLVKELFIMDISESTLLFFEAALDLFSERTFLL
jgi:hypothetical protein